MSDLAELIKAERSAADLYGYFEGGNDTGRDYKNAKAATDVAIANPVRAQVVPQPNREVLVKWRDEMFAELDNPEHLVFLEDVINHLDAILALSPAPLTIDREALTKALDDNSIELSAEEYGTGMFFSMSADEIANAVIAHLSAQPVEGEVEWEQAKWHDVRADDEDGNPVGDTIRLTWDNGTVLIGRLTTPSVGAGHQQTCRMQTVFGGDTWVFPHGSTLTRKVREVQP